MYAQNKIYCTCSCTRYYIYVYIYIHTYIHTCMYCTLYIFIHHTCIYIIIYMYKCTCMYMYILYRHTYCTHSYITYMTYIIHTLHTCTCISQWNLMLFHDPQKNLLSRFFQSSQFPNKLKRSLHRFNILRILLKTVKNLLF